MKALQPNAQNKKRLQKRKELTVTAHSLASSAARSRIAQVQDRLVYQVVSYKAFVSEVRSCLVYRD